MSQEVFIGVNKKKLRMQATIFGVFAILSIILFWGLGDNQDYVSPTVFKAIGSGFTVIFILTGAAKAKKLKDKSAGLLINNKGITDTSSDISIGQIFWKDVIEVDRASSLKHQLLLINVKNENNYVKNAKNTAISRLLRQNIRLYKTPVAINSSNLELSLEEILDIINDFKK